MTIKAIVRKTDSCGWDVDCVFTSHKGMLNVTVIDPVHGDNESMRFKSRMDGNEYYKALVNYGFVRVNEYNEGVVLELVRRAMSKGVEVY